MTDNAPGPLYLWGSLGNLLSAAGQGQASSVLEPDPNPDASPSVLYQGVGIPDIRYSFAKDQVIGYRGVVPALMSGGRLVSADFIPAAIATNNIAAAQNAVSGTAMTLAGASTGIVLNVPVIPFAGFGMVNGATPVTTGLALDFGFAFGTVVSGSTSVTVANSTLFAPGMPLVIGGVGNAGGTSCLLTNVSSITSATVIVIADSPSASNAAAPIGTGNTWGQAGQSVTPTAAMPYIAGGPGLYLDPTQAASRGVQISSADAAATGGNFLVAGYDPYGMLMSELVTVAAGASTGWSFKTFKYIVSVTPQFTDAHLYIAGTSDLFGFAVRADRWEQTSIAWNALSVTASTGFAAADAISPATTTTNDVRGTIQLNTSGPATGIGATATNGSIVSLAMSGRRLYMAQTLGLWNTIRGDITNTIPTFGPTQA